MAVLFILFILFSIHILSDGSGSLIGGRGTVFCSWKTIEEGALRVHALTQKMEGFGYGLEGVSTVTSTEVA
ncbi:MAG: hypothetical protein DBP02_21090 [gamma proteobacterium symbiont of Ctena orbiculata]|nr:MAG: hypothetical protein DBP02_21090 [gamma proteobacterium symbiont of Ctena orbiculata]